jgi:hypothetical protein
MFQPAVNGMGKELLGHVLHFSHHLYLILTTNFHFHDGGPRKDSQPRLSKGFLHGTILKLPYDLWMNSMPSQPMIDILPKARMRFG